MNQLKPQFGSFPAAGHILRDKLVLDLPMLGVGDLNDYSLNGNHGTNNGAEWVAGQYGPALRFDGSSYVDTNKTELPGTSLFADSSQRFTATCWFKIASGNTGTLIAKAGADGQFRTFQIAVVAGDIITNIRGQQTTPFSLAGRYDVLNQVTATWNGSIAKIYFNGEFISNLVVGGEAEETTERIIIGARTNGVGFFLTGDIAYLNIHNRALSPQEIKSLFDNPWQAWQRDNIVLWAAAQGGVTPPTTPGQVILIQTSKMAPVMPILWAMQGTTNRRDFLKHTGLALTGL